MTNKKTLWGILVLVTCIFIFLFLTKPQLPISSPISETSLTDTTLSISPNPLMLSSASGDINIIIDTGKNSVRFVQLRLTYNPKHLTDIKIEPGTLIKKAEILTNTIKPETGTITYMISLPKSEKEIHGKGILVTLHFSSIMGLDEHTTVRFAKDTLVTNDSYPGSLIKKMINGTIERVNNKK